MTDFVPSHPEKEEVVLSLPDLGVTIKNFTDYEFNSNFLTPTDGWSFTIGAASLSDDLKKALQCGQKVQLSINGAIQSTGYIDSIEVNSSRQSGTQWHIAGRDVLAQAVDANADPTVSLTESQTLADAVKSLFASFGWSDDDHFDIANDASRNVKTGSSRGTPLTKGGKKKGPQPLKSFKLHQLRPHYREGVFEFASRISQRFGLWIWPSSDGKTLIVGRPDFDQDPSYTIRRNVHNTTNVLDGSVKFDVGDQPTVIIADGYSGGGEFGRSRVRSITANTAVVTADPTYLDPWNKYKDAKQVPGHFFENPVVVPKNRALYLHDDESHTQEQLDNYVRREMALLQRKSLTAKYTVEGHGQITTEDQFVCWTPDTTIRVDDEIAGIAETMYVLGRTFRKSRHGGTTTHLELIRLNTISFGDPPNPAPAGDGGAPKKQADVSQGRDRTFHEEQSSR